MTKRSLALLMLALCVNVAVQLPAGVTAGPTEDVQAAMQLLKAKATALGPPSIRGEELVAGRTVPVLYFGSTKMNNNFQLVDEIQKEKGGTATIFARSGSEFIRVATNVKKDDGSRAIGTILDPKGKAFAAILKGDSYFGDAEILGRPYITGYEPIRGAGSDVIGVYYVGYARD
ncbi:Cache 3/Cache 2 fusion domain-containing protein [Paracraurococcus lichenis]|uniref:Cache 3/Cache 2 fusion domain-containing protein n=1 Tax=Paracraurococcus lichenis TaxID=3064888 RepID=A0ABT9E0K1_9PROT|nr:Cache 3/Cache 2 fusion domain-containing protein [Paracraurococcus sp. LOR1-02]MDO9709653.1 Cache 3/Cache 2 fusion domain-containing protein [Paracraurococcus sp. LOR1-02]